MRSSAWRTSAVFSRYAVYQYDFTRFSAADAGRPEYRAPNSLVYALECAGTGVARRKKYQCWRAYRVVSVERDAVRSRHESLLARRIRNPRRRCDLPSGVFIARRIRARFSHGPPERSAARPLPAGSGRQRDFLLSASVADA